MTRVAAGTGAAAATVRCLTIYIRYRKRTEYILFQSNRPGYSITGVIYLANTKSYSYSVIQTRILDLKFFILAYRKTSDNNGV